MKGATKEYPTKYLDTFSMKRVTGAEMADEESTLMQKTYLVKVHSISERSCVIALLQKQINKREATH